MAALSARSVLITLVVDRPTAYIYPIILFLGREGSWVDKSAGLVEAIDPVPPGPNW